MLTSSLAPVAFNLAGSTFNNSYVETPIGTTQFPNTTQITAEGNGSGMFGDIFCAYSINEKDPSYVRTSSEVFVYASSVFIVLGLIGNALSVMVFSSKEMRGNSSNVYLLVLALSDSMYLVSVFLTKVLPLLRCLHFNDAEEADIYNKIDFICKLLQFLLDFFSDYSSCLIMAFTVERFIAVYMPVRFKELCTVRRAQLVCTGMLVVITVCILPYHMIYMGLHKDVDVCIFFVETEKISSTLYVVEMVSLRVIPVGVIAVLNVFIIVKVTKMAREKRRRNKPHVKSMAVKKTKHDDRSLQLTIMLILVSSTYIIVYLPVLCIFVLEKLERAEMVHLNESHLAVAYNYTKLLYVVGFAINFFLYTVSGRVFREQLELILCEKRIRHDHSHTLERTTLV